MPPAKSCQIEDARGAVSQLYKSAVIALFSIRWVLNRKVSRGGPRYTRASVIAFLVPPSACERIVSPAMPFSRHVFWVMLSKFRRSGRVSKEIMKKMKSRAQKDRQRIMISRGRALCLICVRFGIQKKHRGATTRSFGFSVGHKTNTYISGEERKEIATSVIHRTPSSTQQHGQTRPDKALGGEKKHVYLMNNSWKRVGKQEL